MLPEVPATREDIAGPYRRVWRASSIAIRGREGDLTPLGHQGALTTL